MIVDTSALIAVLHNEPEALVFVDLMLAARSVRISAGTLLEARIVAEREAGVEVLNRLLERVEAEVVAVDASQTDLAFDGFRRFGKGRHPAGLNFGDCFAYALAQAFDEPLLFKGGDFSQTDVRSARAVG